jgi:hypothetical protein
LADDDALLTEEKRVDRLRSDLSVIRAIAEQVEHIAHDADVAVLDDARVELMVYRVRGLLEVAISVARAASGAAHVDPHTVDPGCTVEPAAEGTRARRPSAVGILRASRGEGPRRTR